jgi:hypothetical protein
MEVRKGREREVRTTEEDDGGDDASAESDTAVVEMWMNSLDIYAS